MIVQFSTKKICWKIQLFAQAENNMKIEVLQIPILRDRTLRSNENRILLKKATRTYTIIFLKINQNFKVIITTYRGNDKF